MTLQDDFAREGRSLQVKHLNKSVEIELNIWGKRWELNGINVSCRHCGGSQKISDSGTSFQKYHSNYCVFFDSAYQQPIGELAAILSDWRFELWQDEFD
jgi:hypothetical protein